MKADTAIGIISDIVREASLDDDVIVGHGDSGKRGRASCEALMNELNESDRKCDLLKKIMEDK